MSALVTVAGRGFSFVGFAVFGLVACSSPSASDPHGLASASPRASASALAGGHRLRKVSHAPKPHIFWDGPHDLAASRILNERDEDGRAIWVQGAVCRVQVPPSGPIPEEPNAIAYDYEEVDCPLSYDDPAWDDCTRNLVKEPKGCFCTPETDEPPSPGIVVDCPKP